MTEFNPNRCLKIAYYNTDPMVVDRLSLILENKIKSLGEFNMLPINSLDDENLKPCDLLIVTAQQIPEEDIGKWLKKLSGRVTRQASIWIPALIISDAPYKTLQNIMPEAIQMNWYFDIVATEHLDSLPIRIANLLRIHDHLHEIKRYQKTVESLQQQTNSLLKEVENLKAKNE